MIVLIRAASLAISCGLLVATPATGASTADGLVRVTAPGIDEAFLWPGADFRPYAKVLLKGVAVAFEKNWLRDANRRGATLSGRVTHENAERTLESARAGFDDAWAASFRSAGYGVVEIPGDDVILVSPTVVDLVVNAPERSTSGIDRDYLMQAGEATLDVELRDSATGRLLARFRDRRPTMKSPTPRRADAAFTNRAFERLFGHWAAMAVRELSALRALSPPVAPPGADRD